MNCARNCENLLNFVKVIPKTLLVPFFSGHGVYSALVSGDLRYSSTIDHRATRYVTRDHVTCDGIHSAGGVRWLAFRRHLGQRWSGRVDGEVQL